MKPGGQYTTRITPQFYQNLSGLPSRAPFAAILLYDFETDKDELRAEHHEGLRRYFTGNLSQNMSVWVIGFASRLGEADHNMGLSHRRACSVVNRISFLSDFGGSLGVMQLGETQSQGGGEDDMYRRSVLVLAYRRPPPPPPPPPPPRPPAQNSRAFKVTLAGGAEGGELLVGCDYHFIIDYDERAANAPPSAPVEYVFIGMGFGAGLPVGVQGGELWNYFSTNQAMTPDDFYGKARLTSIGITVGEASLSATVFTLMPDSHRAIPMEGFQSQGGLSAGGSVIVGGFIQQRILN